MVKLNQENGFVLITALLIMIVLTLIGLGAIMNSSVEMKIAGNQRLEKTALFAADSGVEVVPEIVNFYIFYQPQSATDLTGGLQYIMTDNSFISEIMGYSGNDSATDSPSSNPDVQMTIQGRQVGIDIDRILVSHFGGGSGEQHGEYEGAESGGQGGTGMAYYYRAGSQGQAAQGTNRQVEIVYRRLL